ncbi:hypothetical protein SAMN04488498_14017 [Mesorhizobium albiziae]|uniref:Uncharacterized protein n=1 Tax=Neomesorhizobium albiziae TaxID=335020 RepID=A0A1I4FBB1_9HYPH|nr:hypothetical protein SAMN04488498_14017 [Mesorhizobium albiziae]
MEKGYRSSFAIRHLNGAMTQLEKYSRLSPEALSYIDSAFF